MSMSPDVRTSERRSSTDELDLERLTTYLSDHVDLAGPLDATLIAGGRSNPTYGLSDSNSDWILRRPPHGLVLESAHDMGREVRVISSLDGSAVPVPKVVHFCEDPTVIGAPFYVMERLDGRTIRSRQDAEQLSEQERRGVSDAMIATLADLHVVDPRKVGLQDFGRPEGYLGRQLRRWRTQWEAAHTTDRPQVEELIRRLERSVPDTIRTGIVHGDYKVDNLMLDLGDASRPVGLLDWEMSTLGDTLADVGLMISFWDEEGSPFNPLTRGVTALPGFRSRSEMIAAYADRVKLDRLDQIEWYVSLADFKIAVIFEQIHVRHTAGQTVGEGFDGMGDMVEPLLDRALTRLA